MIQKPMRYSFDSRKGLVDHRLPASVVDDGGRAGRRQTTGKDPATVRHQPVVERVDAAASLQAPRPGWRAPARNGGGLLY